MNAGSVSSVVTVQRQDTNGIPVTSGSLVVNLGTNSTGVFYSNVGGTMQITTVDIAAGSSSASFYYRDTFGKPILTASSGSLTSATTQFTIALVTGPATKLVYTAGTTQTVAAGSVSAIVTVQRQDANGNPTTTGAITVNLATSASSTGKFYSDASGTTVITTITINDGSSSANFYYKDTAVGTPTLTASYTGLTSATTTFTISNAPSVFENFGLTGYPTSIVSGVSFGNVNVTAYDQYGKVYTSYTGSIWFTTSDNTWGVLPTNANSGNHFTFSSSDKGTYIFTGFKLITQPSQTITVTDGVKSTTSNAITVTPPATKLMITSGGSQSLAIDSLSGEVVVQRQDLNSNPVNAAALVVGLYSTSSGATFYSDAGITPTTSVTIPAGANSTSFWYKDSVAGSPTLTASAGTLTSATTTFTISAGAATTLVYTTSTQTLPAGSVSSVITVQRQDVHGNPVTSGAITVGLSSSSSAGNFYSDVAGKNLITSIQIIDGSSTASYYYNDTKVGQPSLTASSAGLTSAIAQYKINAGSIAKLAYILGAAQTLNTTVRSTAIEVEREDFWGNPVTTGGGIAVGLASSSSGGAFYLFSSGGSSVTSVAIASGASYGTFYYQDSNGGTPTLTASYSGLGSATTTFTINHYVSITMTSSPVGSGYVTVDGNAITTPKTFTWLQGSTHTIAASGTVPGATGVQYVWTTWSDSGTQSHTYTVPSATATVTATYKTQYQLTVTSAHDTPNPASGTWFDSGTSVTEYVTSPADQSGTTQYRCTGWTGTGSVLASGTAATTTFTITAASTITWNWITQYQVSFAVTPTSSGTTTPSAATWYDAGSSANSIVATAGSGYSFSTWSATTGITIAVPASASTTATVNAAGTITATFTVAPVFQIDSYGSNSATSGTTVTVSGLNCAAGDVIVVFARTHGGSSGIISVSGVSSTSTQTWASRGSVSGHSGDAYVAEYYTVATSAVTSVTVTFSGSLSGDAASVIVFSVSGANTANPFDSHSGLPYSAYGSSGTPSVGSVSTSNAHDMIIGLVGSRSTTAATAGTGFSIITTQTASTDGSSAAEKEVVTSTLSSATVNFGSSQTGWAMMVDAIRAAS